MFKFLFRSKLSLILDGLGCLVNLIVILWVIRLSLS